jgi:hypothetical protein
MNKKALRRLSLLFYALIFAAGLLFYLEISSVLALLLFAGSFIGIIFVERRLNSLPLDAHEKLGWQATRSQGRKSFLLRGLRNGVLTGALFFGFQIIKNLHHKKAALDGFWLIIALTLLIILVPIYINFELWKLNEQRFKD